MVLMRNGGEYTTSPPRFEMARMGYPGCYCSDMAAWTSTEEEGRRDVRPESGRA
jgi:hypothetical protein